jgi:diaminopimelate decarboxylase
MPTTRDANGDLYLCGVKLEGLALDPSIQTPTYVYDLGGIAREARELLAALEGERHLVAYAVKANSAGPIVRTLAKEGCGADVVSGAELGLALACGITPDKIVYSGVAKTDDELDQALLAGPRGILAIQVESVEEIRRVRARAASVGRTARVSIRVNPAVDLATLATHTHIATGHDEAKFGVAIGDLPAALSLLGRDSGAELVGLSVHVGSQFTDTRAYVDAARSLFRIALDLRASGVDGLSFVDSGGGFGVDYGEGSCPRPADFVRAARAEKRAAGLGDLALHVEPGRCLVAASGVLLARVVQCKVPSGSSALRWLMIDAGMNDLIRPALYQARHRIVSLAEDAGGKTASWRVVGPVCESSDDFGAHVLPDPPPPLVAILDSGAYGFTMASRYNGRAQPAEIFLVEGRVADRRARGSLEQWVKERAG